MFRKLRKYDPASSEVIESYPKVSVIICARDEEENLKCNLPHIIAQDYPVFEIIVVNDHSVDGSERILQKFQKEHQHFKYLNVKGKNKGWQGKKKALALGIGFSQHDLLIMTDADTRPQSDQWIRQMTNQFKNTTEIVLGFSPYKRLSGILNAFIRYETFQTALQYLSYALAGLPYMGVGRNLSYRKSLFTRNNGFEDHKTISGDDDLFVNANSNTHNTRICIDESAFMYSMPETSWTGWLKQKYRHLSTGFQYKAVHKLLLGGYIGSQIMFYLSLIVLLIVGIPLWIVAAIYLLRLVVMMYNYNEVMKKLDSSDLIKYVPILDVFYTFYYIVFIPKLLFKPNLTTWK
ncbi:MAG: glycosyltransferase [Chitinophagales bacterium]|nr:glycosyltransferase [Chitinophagales bacterium]